MTGLSICIPIEPPEHGGGGFRFLRNLEAYLDRSGIPWTRDAGAGMAVLLMNSWQVGVSTVIRAAWARPDVTVVHRIDGAAIDYGRNPQADRAQGRVNQLADLTIFQSRYCRYSTRQKFGVITQDGPIIHNPVDLQIFRPDGPRAVLPAWSGPTVCAVTWSTNPRKGSASLYRLAAALPKVRFVLCGRFDSAPALPNLHRLGVVDADALAAAMRACDLLVTFSENEACPNVVLEALASGLPILYLDSGATRELVAECGEAVTEASFADALERVLVKRDPLGREARTRAERHFAPDDIFAAYLREIENARRGPATRLARSASLIRRAIR